MDGKPISHGSDAFTLVELAIVLVIIGLLIGGVMAGRDLIEASQIRATIAQIDKYRAATFAFQNKYNCVPGDCKNAANFGFPARGIYTGEGDGNGLIESTWVHTSASECTVCQGGGETGLYWVDLSMAGLIEEPFTSATYTIPGIVAASAINRYMPAAKIGQGNAIYIYAGNALGMNMPNGFNYFGISAPSAIGNTCGGCMTSATGLTPVQAFAFDTKLDDGAPQSGRITAQYLNTVGGQGQVWAGLGTTTGPTPPYTTAVTATATTCYDNDATAGTPQHYSTSQTTTGLNCALSFRL